MLNACSELLCGTFVVRGVILDTPRLDVPEVPSHSAGGGEQ